MAVFLSILFSTVGGNIADEFEKAAQTPAFRQVVASPTPRTPPILANGSAARRPGAERLVVHRDPVPGAGAPVQAGVRLVDGLVFLMGAGVGLIAFLLLLFMPKVELRATSAAAAVRAEAGATPAAPMDQEA